MLRFTTLMALLGPWLSSAARYNVATDEGHKEGHKVRQKGGAPPFVQTDPIVVIGGGPAGVHMASRMKQLGYTNIRVLERTDRVGGKSLTLYRNYTGECIQQKDHMGKVDTSSCVAHEMGTCFLHNGYHTIRDLVDEYNLSWVVAPEGRAMFSHYAKDQWHSQSMHDFVSASIMDGIKQKKISVPFWALTEELKVSVALVEAVAKYNALHKEIVGEVEFSMPSRLPQESLERINMTFLEFLEGNDLHALSGSSPPN